ncbi:MAG: CaiB/BaiF CoA transferase family protein [Gammaproteobacteria bacterium]
MKSLNEVLVVSLEQAVAAPYCSRLLAEAGARVIKLERPGGDFARHYDSIVNGESAYFVWLNVGKESLEIDLKKDEEKQLLKRLLSKADVFIQNIRPGALARLGFDETTLNEINSGLITCNISGYGEEGDFAAKKAYDFLVQAEAGLVSVTGPADSPSRVGISVCDISTGLTAYSEILRALIEREQTGKGKALDISLFGVMSEWMSVPLAYYKYGDKLLGGTGVDHAQIAPYGVHQAIDGPFIIAVQHNGEWKNLCEKVLNRPELVDDPKFRNNPDRVENRPEVTAAIEAVTAKLTRKEVAKLMESASIAYGDLNNCADVWDHPALQTKSINSQGKTSTFVRRVCDDETETRDIPALGQHGAEIRAEFSK